MTSSAEQMRRYTGPVLFSFGFRPFFLAGACLAAALPLLTALALGGRIDLSGAYGPIAYHGHEMVYGYLAAIICGFILTAVPNWTGRLPVLGWRLAAIFALWLAGRAALFAAGSIGPVFAAMLDAPLLFVMSAFLWREIFAGKNWRNAPVCVVMTLLAIGNVIWHWNILAGRSGTFGLYWGIAVIAVLLALIGGRITPSFTRNWLVKTGRRPIEAPVSVVDKFAIGILVVAMIAWLFAPGHAATGGVLILAAGAHFYRLSRWGGWRTISEPLVVVLHVGYLWLPVSLALLGASAIAPANIAPSTALHALTAGAAGVMTLAVMTRATLGHTGRPLQADGATTLIYALVNLGAAMRIAAPLAMAHYVTMITIAAALWGSAFLLFAVVYGRYLMAPKAGAKTPSRAAA